MLPIFVINAILVLIYAVIKNILGVDITFENILLSLTYGGNVVENGWYLLSIMLFYEIFYVSAKYTARHVNVMVLFLTLLYMLLTMFVLKMPTWWYISSMAFPFGVLFGTYKLKIDKLISTHYSQCLITSSLLLILCFLSLYLLGKEDGIVLMFPHYVVSILNLSLSAIHGVLMCFELLLILMVLGKRLNNGGKIVDRMSAIYLEIYVMQGLAFNIMRNKQWSIENNWSFLVASIVLTILLAALIHPFFQCIIKSIRK